MSLKNAAKGKSIEIDWDEDFDMENNEESCAANDTITYEKDTTLLEKENQQFIIRNAEIGESDTSSDVTIASTTISDVSIMNISRQGSKKRPKKKLSWKAKKQRKADSMRRLRENKEYVEKEKRQKQEKIDNLSSENRKLLIENKRKQMSDFRKNNESYRQKEKDIDMEGHRLRRQDDDYHREEQTRNTIEHRIRRQDDEFRREEQTRNTIQHRERRLNESFHDEEQTRNTIEHRIRRQDDEFRREEQTRNTIEHRIRREDDDYRREEQTRNTIQHRERRLDELFRQRERIADRTRRTLANNTERAIVHRYNEGIKEGTDYVCLSCGGLFYKRSVKELNENDFGMNLGHGIVASIISSLKQVQIRTDNKLWICITCSEYVRLRQELPTLCLANNLKLPDVLETIVELNDTEERLCSPRIAFIRIIPLKWDRQKGLRGNVVNVPVDVMETVKLLPRSFSATETIQVNFMRRMNYNQAYLSDQVRPRSVVLALQDLANSDLFRKLGIELDLEYIRRHQSLRELVDYIVDPNENQRVDSEEEEENDDLDLGVIHRVQKLYDENDDDNQDNEGDPNQQLLPTMLLNDDERAGNQVSIRIAPGQHALPISYMHDDYAEEATFLKIFGGHIVIERINQRVTLQGRCKSYFRNYDRRCATNIPYIFYMYRKLMCQKLLSAINISLKKSIVRQNITAQEALNSRSLIEKMNDDDYQRFMSSIRSSPEYWTTKKRQMFAMIRQLGCPVFFITLSPAEIDWPELIILLHRLYEPDEAKKNITVEDVARMNRQTKIDLVSRDPVTTARYFENRTRHLINFMFHKEGPFKEDPIVDYFWRIEFQARGSPHAHMLVWMKNRPTYIVGSALNSPENEAIIDLIDKYITCESPESSTAASDNDDADQAIREHNEEQSNAEREEYEELGRLIKFQIHVHKANCLVESWPSRFSAHARDDRDGKEPIDEDNFDEGGDDNNASLHKFCKYGFPWPILDRTLILDPLVDAGGKVFASGMQNSIDLMKMVDTARSNFFRIKSQLNRMARDQARCRKNKTKYSTITTFGQFLDKLELSFDDYILALRTSINTPTVFLKRTCYEIMINPYNKKTFLKHKANMDIQVLLI